jgi:dipeptidyl aminopeptidase/acylaminoacyl peptidase
LFLSGGVWVADVSGQTAARQINSDTHALSAAWSPDGWLVAVVSGTSIYTLDVQNNWTQQTLASGKDPSWSPDSQQITYSFDGNIYLANADGSTSGAQPLAAGLQPVWSPSGEQIAYINNNALFVMNVDGTDQKQIAPNAQSPVCAPIPPQ